VHNLKAITALGGSEPQVDIIGSLTITECPNWAIASIAACKDSEGSLATAFKEAMGMALPKPAKSTEKNNINVFWTSPNQYFVEAPIAQHELLADMLVKSLKQTASVTEQTDGFVRFDLTGESCSEVFERLCILDTRVMKKGAVSRTSLEHSGCFVLCRASDHFSVYGPRSTAGSIHHALVTAAKSALN